LAGDPSALASTCHRRTLPAALTTAKIATKICLMRIVTLITDYGTGDYYVGVLKGVILSIAPEVGLVDVTHDIEPHSIMDAAFVLRQVWPCFPPGTIHLVVVDPGVGSPRRILLGRYADRFVVAPDNGLVTWLHRDYPTQAMYVIDDQRYFLPSVSATFDGRDIMAPVAAHLARGVNPQAFGPLTDRVEILPLAHRAEVVEHGLRGRVIYVDRFGNLVTNIHNEQLTSTGARRTWEVVVEGSSVGPVRRAFFEVPPGEPLAFIGSTGLLEVAVNQGSAAQRFGRINTIIVEQR